VDKKILGDRFLHPFTILNLLFNRPAAIPYFPYLERRFLDRVAQGGGSKGDEKQQNKNGHAVY
jgi:hypothetical protein